MKHLSFLCLCFLVFSTTVFSQAYESSQTYNKKKQQAITIDYGYPQEAVQNAIVEKIQSMGYKARQEKGLFNSDKGFIVFKNALLSDISDETLDYIVKIERKSRKEKDETTLYLLLNDAQKNTLENISPVTVGRAKSFLNNMLPDIEAANLELQITAQEDIVVKAEKKYKDLTDDQASMEKKIKQLQDDLKKNASDQASQQRDIEAQKKALELLKDKRKIAPATL